MSVNLLIEKTTKDIEEQIKSIKDVMAQGNLEDFSNYRMQCGRIQGMEEALAILLHTKKVYMLDEDDNE